MIPPGPPQLAGRKGKGRQRPSFDSLLFWGVPGAQANAPPHAVRRKGRRARRCRILWPPGAERPGTPRAGGYLSVSVSCRTRSRRPTPSRPAPGRRVKGKISRQGALYVGVSFIRRPSSEKAWLKRPGRLCLRKIKPFSTRYSASVCEGRSCINALGPPACLQAAGPVDASSRDSLAALSAAATVQVPHPVQCVRR